MKHERPSRARNGHSIRWGLGFFAALSAVSGRAQAQADIMPPPPNIMLLVDTSGSMDYKTNSNSFPACHYSGATTTATVTSEKSRWIELVEVLTGSINSYHCQKLDRNAATFRTEYAIGGVAPYDALYANPYFRPVSNDCVAGPGAIDLVNKAAFPLGAIKFHPYNNTGATCATYDQVSDGILDQFKTDVRFGLMTFDTEPRADKDMNGLWSYYLTSSKRGQPLGCNTLQDQEVGVRNAEAPPWEGRAVGFGDSALGSSEYLNRNSMIQQVLLATRPYGATPIAGMLDDARAYFTADTSADPLDSSFKFGPLGDPAAECRHQAIILLSDGQPNLDLRPYCEPSGCPYDKSEDIAQDLKSKGIEIYVIGFALSSVTVGGVPKSCSSFTAADFDVTVATGICAQNPNDQAIQACCALNRIAAAGGHAPTSPTDADWRRAHFADNRDQLRAELAQAIGSNFNATTRTPVVPAAGSGYLSQTSDLDFARAFRFSASFKPGDVQQVWRGELNRGRYRCVADSGGTLQPVLQPADASLGDKFVDNVNASGPAARNIYTVLGTTPIVSDASMRPNLASGVVDGVGTYAGALSAPAKTSTQLVTDTPPEALNLNGTNCTGGLTTAQCRDRILKWLVGLDNGTVYQRCPSVATGNCNLVADFYHSVPRAVPGRPSQFLVDNSYQKFVTDQVTAKRPSMLYASSNDGFLHAFKILQVDKNDAAEAVTVKTKTTNELWTFIPPAVLPRLPGFYPGSHQLLLDGTPAIKEVVATADSTLPSYKFRLERTSAQAQGGTGEWRTILVQSFGAQYSGYFAIDVTDPVLTGSGGPKFLWQLTTDSTGAPLFGSGGGSPIITTVFLGGKEIAVAILPGGYANEALRADAPGNPNTGCVRGKTDWPKPLGAEDATPRTNIPCYSGRAIQARSLTVVRLDSGQILRTFRRVESEVPGLVGKGVFTQALLDSPMTGQPVAYPADVGAVADRVFMGDQDGALWRLNLTSDTGVSSDWKMDLFLDAFPKSAPFSQTWKSGQPIISAPVISVDAVGNLTLALSTGSQEAVGAAAGLANYVWSLTEVPSADRTQLNPKINWHLDFTGSLSGDRVIGDLALFNGDLFFVTLGPTPASNACSSGSGKVWGMHYTVPNSTGTGKGGRLSTSLGSLVGAGGYVDASTLLGSSTAAYLSGAIVAQQPTCEAPGASVSDGYFGYGSQATTGNVTPGKYQLIIPTGDKTTTSTQTGVSAIKIGGGNAAAIDLQQPPVTLFVDSWASIVE